MSATTLSKVIWENQTESIHRRYIGFSDAEGTIHYQLGDPHFNICLRSCAKPLQVLPLITTGSGEAAQFPEHIYYGYDMHMHVTTKRLLGVVRYRQKIFRLQSDVYKL